MKSLPNLLVDVYCAIGLGLEWRLVASLISNGTIVVDVKRPPDAHWTRFVPSQSSEDARFVCTKLHEQPIPGPVLSTGPFTDPVGYSASARRFGELVYATVHNVLVDTEYYVPSQGSPGKSVRKAVKVVEITNDAGGTARYAVIINNILEAEGNGSVIIRALAEYMHDSTLEFVKRIGNLLGHGVHD